MKDLMQKLIELCEDMAKGCYDQHQELFELTKSGEYPEEVSRLAEAFGMMMVKVETREYRLAQIIEDLKKTSAELAAAQRQLTLENKALKKTLRDNFTAERILGKSRAIQKLKETIKRVADTSVNVLISGETGTGKELIAQSVHFGSHRAEQPFVAINCSAVPEGMLEAELFGIEKGIATGVDRRIGKLELAAGGTLFLDEIGDMPLNAQAKVLRVLEDKTLERVGGRVAIPVDIRLVAATNKNLAEEVEQGNFRQDLYYRLNVVQLTAPPLRERRDDIPLLLVELLKIGATAAGRPGLRFAPELLEQLAKYPWPGNVRQLKNEVDRAVALAYSDTITFADLSDELSDYFNSPQASDTLANESSLKENELQIVRSVLRETGGNRSEAARRLGISREGLRKKLKRYGIDAENPLGEI
ncbi:MAG: sigma-54 dependent transcriptional regulator [Desulfuromonadales bacterium]|nr:sigma-54 dependent transcriptional regulator [Desulfuromonadales bacterium]